MSSDRTQSGDADEFDRFVAEQARALARLAWAVAGDRVAGEDLLQATLVKVWRNWPRVRSSEDPPSYVRRILINVHLTGSRRLWSRERPQGEVAESIATHDPYDTLDMRLSLERALRVLPARQRVVIALRFLEERSGRETAQIMGCSEGTVGASLLGCGGGTGTSTCGISS